MKIRHARRMTSLVLVALLAVLAMGCGDKTEEQAQTPAPEQAVEAPVTLTEAQEAMVAQAATIAVAVEKAPAMAEAILKDAGVTLEQYEAMAYEIAGSPALSEAFEKAKAGL